MEPTESDGLTESVAKESAEESPVVREQPVKRVKKGLINYKFMVRKLMSRVNDKVTSPKVVKSKLAAVAMSLGKIAPVLSKMYTGMVPRIAVERKKFRYQ